MSENKNAKEVTPLDKKKIAIIVSVVLAALLLALIPIIITSLNQGGDNYGDTDDTGETFSGTYTMNLGVGSDSYTFVEGRKVVSTSFIDEEVTKTYSYAIAVENGQKLLKLTDDAGEVTAHTFEVGSMSRQTYKCSNQNCSAHDPEPNEGSTVCPNCLSGELTPTTLKFELFVIDGESYYEQAYHDWWNKN